MKFVCMFFICFLFIVSCEVKSQPVTEKKPKEFIEHGNKRIDNYYWLSDPSDSNVINHLEQENKYVESYMKHTEKLQKKIYGELISRIPPEDESLPIKRNGYWYYTRFGEGKQYPYYIRKKNIISAKEEITLNVPVLAKHYQIYLVRDWSISPNNKYMAYGIDTNGGRKSVLYLKNLADNKLYPEAITNTSASYEWANDNKTIYYVINDHTVRPYKVMKHTLGTDSSTDIEIYSENDSTYGVELSKSRNNKYIFIHSRSTNSTEDRFIDADNIAALPVLIQHRKPHLEYTTHYYEGKIFHIYTNKDAENFKLVSAPINTPGIEYWKDVIPASDKTFLEDAEVLKNYYVAQTKENGLAQIKFFNRTNKKWNKINFGEEDYVAEMSLATDDYSSDSIRYNFTSLKTPGSEYMYNLKTGERKLLKRQKVGGNFNPALYETKRLWSTSDDGTKVPVSFIYRKDKFKRDGTAPLLLYGYGSYGINIDPSFNSAIISLLDRGISFAIAHIRGGEEMGRDWFEKGRILHKKNTFTDFVDAAQFLVNEKYTSPGKLFANGKSAGGMLMGAIVNMRPDLFKGVLAEVPWMDVVTDMFNTDIPLTTLEYDQWGDPNKKEFYDYMLSWSPLDNVKPAKYPAILATAGLNDTQVPYFSPAKWVAKVRENNLGNNPVLLKINMGAGHGGESGRYESQKLTALKYAFILDQLGLNF